MATSLSADQWRRIARLWAELAEISSVDVEAARQHAGEGLLALVGGSHVLTVIQRRIAPESSPMAGFRPVFSRDMGPNLVDRRRILVEWMRDEPDLAGDPVLRLIARGVGRRRTVRHRGDVDAESWARAPVRRLLERLGLEDRVNAILPLGPDTEVSFCIDRPRGEAPFDEADAELLLAAIEGLRPLAARFVRSNGFMPGQRSLAEEEKVVVGQLLSAASPAEIATALDLRLAHLHRLTDEIYRKLGVSGRIELMDMWLRGAAPQRGGLSAEARGQEAVLLTAAESDSDKQVERAREALEGALGGDELTIDAVARELGLSARTLQRQLGDADTSFRELLEEVRRRRAEVLLTVPSLSFAEIAFRLSYGQVSSFNRAVKRWTSMTPSQWREQLSEQ